MLSMTMRDNRQRIWWAVCGGYLLLIYLTLPLTPLLVNNLWRLLGREQTGLLMNFALAVSLSLPLLLVLHRSWRVLLQVAPTLLLAALVLNHIDNPSERLHLIMYGGLGGLFYLALERPADYRGLLLAVGLTALAGSLDETIQALLPNRYGDVKDVLINTLGGVLGVWLAWHLFPTTPRPTAALADRPLQPKPH